MSSLVRADRGAMKLLGPLFKNYLWLIFNHYMINKYTYSGYTNTDI